MWLNAATNIPQQQQQIRQALPTACQIISIVSTSFFNNLLPLLQQLHGFRITFSNRFTFFATDSEFSATISLFVAPTHFFTTNPQQCCNNCSNTCFLSDYSTTLWREGGPFREPSGLSIGWRRSRFSFGGTFFGLIFRNLFFYKKCILGAKRCFKMAPKLAREATSELIFTFSSEPWFWTTL